MRIPLGWVALSAAVLACGSPSPIRAGDTAEPSKSGPFQPHAQSASRTSADPAFEPNAGPQRLRIHGTQFVEPDGQLFSWRGITAFRLVEFVATGREADAVAFLDWAAKHDVTVVRVLTMARHLFTLAPDDGLRALPRLLELAAERGLHVEVVALADTKEFQVDLPARVAEVGRLAATHPNAVVEIANEPFHPTQHSDLHDRALLGRLAREIPDAVLVAWGSDAPGQSGGGDYVTVHMPRGDGGWSHVLALAEGAALVQQYGRPVVSDEPIGAAAKAVPGRRDDSAERFRAAALLTRMTGMHATFHYEGGLQGLIPQGREREAFAAWREAWQLLPEDIEKGTFQVLPARRGAAFAVDHQGTRWILTVDGSPALGGVGVVRTWANSALLKTATD